MVFSQNKELYISGLYSVSPCPVLLQSQALDNSGEEGWQEQQFICSSYVLDLQSSKDVLRSDTSEPELEGPCCQGDVFVGEE